MENKNDYDPKEKKELDDDETVQQDSEDSVFLVNDDGTDFDSSERTYVSVDLPEEDSGKVEDAGK